jgi:long-chain fatty acid transport protein
MTTSRLYKKTLLAVAVSSLTFASTQATAAGFQLNAQSATGLGRAFAGDAVIADNASVMARNAAAMTLFDSHQFSGGLNVISTDIKVTDVKAGGIPIDDANNGSNSPVPNIYYIHRINDKFAVGAGIYSNFGTKNKFDDSFGSFSSPNGPIHTGASALGGNTEIQSVNFTLNVAYRINEQWSVGGGLDVVQGSGKLERTATVTNQQNGQTGSTNLVDIDASGIGLGFNLGTVFELNDDNRFGLAYHKQPEIEATGDFSGLAGSQYQNLYLPLPDMVEFSGFHKIQDTKFAVHYSVQWIGWSVFDKLEGDVPGAGRQIIGSPYEWKDGWHYALGGTYYLNESWTLRAGYMYDTAAQDQITSISVPDSDRQWLSAGFGYNFKEHHTVDFGFTYLMGKDVSVVDGGGILTATTRADAILAGLQYSYSF